MSYTLSISEQRPNYYKVMTACGEYELNIIGNRNLLLEIPIKFYYGVDVSPKKELRPLSQPAGKLARHTTKLR